jgi:ferredoxin
MRLQVLSECLGCGICETRCPEKAICMVQPSPAKEDIKEYFSGFTPEL